MKWASSLAQDSDLKTAFESAAEQIKTELNSQPPDLLLCFLSPSFSKDYKRVPELATSLLHPREFAGCSAGGLIGGGVELEGRNAAVSLSAAILPDVNIKSFHIEDKDLPDADAAPCKWEELMHVKSEDQPHFILLPDPFTFRIDILAQGLDYAFSQAVKIGGLASGANQPGHNALFLKNETYSRGAVGLSLSGDIQIDSIVAQGCRPVGPTYRVTKCKDNILLELDGKPAVQALYEVLEKMTPKDQQLAKYSLFLGVVMDEFKDNFQHGDFLIRNILGLEQISGALLVGELLRNERTVQFHLRDAETSSDDLRSMLKQYKDRANAKPKGALLFSCLGRGEHLYGIPNHDSNCFKDYIGAIPLGGFFCNGEIGPVGGTTFLHGYTSSFGLFREKDSKN